MIARRLLTTFRIGIRKGIPARFQHEMIVQMKAKGLSPLPKGKGIMHIFYISMPLLYLLHIIVVKRNEKENNFWTNDSFL